MNFIYLFSLVLSSLICISAHANFVGNDTQNFNPTPNGIDFITVHSSQTLASGVLNSGLFVNTSRNVLPTIITQTGEKLSSGNSITFNDLSLGYGLSSDIEFGLSLSYLVNQSIDQNNDSARFSATGLNEMRLLMKYGLLQRNPTGFALMLSANINEVGDNPFGGHKAGPTFNIESAVDHKFGNFLLAGNLGYRLRDNGTAISGSAFQPLPSQVIASLGANYYFTEVDTKIIAEIYAAKPTASVASQSKRPPAPIWRPSARGGGQRRPPARPRAAGTARASPA